MKLTRIELQGFKTFVDRTVLDFDQGITAILGPNGCGKSNIVDAVRWVLGEQSPKTLRGDSMQDVIFKGTTKRKAVSLCEVALTFDNQSRRLPVEYDEVCIRRRVTREGGSDYFLNGSLCRLKDIHDLLWDSGVGNTAYSIIEHAMINTVLNEHNQELRRIIEEGSGITKYKARRREAERKLERTEQDLLRLNDIVAEIEREVRSLARQVGKARRHQRLFRQIKALDVAVADRRRQQMDREEAAAREQLQELTVLSESDGGELAALRARLEEVKPELDEREAERRQLEDSLQAYEEELQEAERRVLLQEHRLQEQERRLEEAGEAILRGAGRQEEVRGQIADLEARLREAEADVAAMRQELGGREEALRLLDERLAADRRALEQATQLSLEFVRTDAARQGALRELQLKSESRRERLAGLAAEAEKQSARRAEAEARLAGLDTDRERLAARRGDLLRDLAAGERRLTELEAEAETLQERLARQLARREALESRHELLLRLQQEYRGYGEGARAVLRAHAGETRVRGSLAEGLQVDDDHAPAVEALLSDLLDAVVVDGADTALDLAGELRERRDGRASFLADPRQGAGAVADAGTGAGAGADPGAGEAAAAVAAGEDGPAPAGGRRALEVVGGSLAGAPHLRRLLARTWIFADDAAAARAAREHAGRPLVFLSRTGLLLTGDGLVRGGQARDAEVGLLGREEKLEKLAGEIADLRGRIAAEQGRQEANRAAMGEGKQAQLRARGELEILEADLRRVHVGSAEAGGARDAALRRLQEIESEGATLRQQLEQLAREEEVLSSEVAESGRLRQESSGSRDEIHRRVAAMEKERDADRAAAHDLRLRLQAREGFGRETTAAIGHLRQTLAELAARAEDLRQEIEHGRLEREELRNELAEHRERLAGGMEERERRRRLVQAAAEAIRGLHGQTAAWHDRIAEIEKQRQACRERMHEAETTLATLDVRRRNLVERLEEQYGGRWNDLVRGLDPEHLPPELAREDGVFQLEQAQQLLAGRKEELARLGPVNQLALEEYESKKERLKFLQGQREDVDKARQDLQTAIARINRTARKLFADTFEEVRKNFISVFEILFEGGRADLQIVRTDDPLESKLHVVAQPKGKVVDHVALLSGGERCLTALSLLFAVYLVKPSPFCMLDEVDAPLDDANIGRFVRMLREFSRHTQFLVVTHNKLTMETANHLYGVTMMEQGVSSIVSVSFQDVAETQSDAELGRAIANRRREVDRRLPAAPPPEEPEPADGSGAPLDGPADDTILEDEDGARAAAPAAPAAAPQLQEEAEQ